MFHTNRMIPLAPWVAALGLAPEARIDTEAGPVRAEDLVPGQCILTRDNGAVPLVDLRIGLGAPAERRHFPVLITRGAMGFGLPRADLRIGAQQKVLFQNIRVPLMFGVDAVLVRGKSLAASHEGVHVDNAPVPASFVQLVFATHQIIHAEGLPVESTAPDGMGQAPYPTLRSWELRAAVA
ncbi:MAG: Hint domain [Rhodobacteraceae bacterium HLUCCA08]|nr:MAG: Hint domain [Rhodobacteraceae bacterium HLUCCA08]